MIIDLPDTTVSKISKALVNVREEGGAVDRQSRKLDAGARKRGVSGARSAAVGARPEMGGGAS